MTAQEFWNIRIRFLNLCAVYYVVQLIRCVLFSFIIFALILILRKTVLKNKVFFKGALWSLFVPVLFIGKMKFFYENRIGVKLFSRFTAMCMNHVWICWLYLCVVLLYTARLLRRRKELKRMVTGMERRMVDGTIIYVTDIPVTPSTVGAFRPKIVIPEVILKEYDRKEFQTILLHEKTHIRLGHLLFYLMWDILRVLLWLNPLFAMSTKYFREDMEEICDRVTIKRSECKAYDYGQLLLKSMMILQAESEDFNMYAAFTGNKEYRSVRQRVTRIAAYKPYKRAVAAGTLIAVVLYVTAAFLWMQHVSYGRCNPLDSIVVYDMGTGTKLISDGEALREAASYDENYIYVNTKIFQELIKDSTVSSENICFYVGGYYKLPGIGAGSGGFGYLETGDSENGILKIGYEETEDILGLILKII
ncbi:MAG: M56 family metallopeptidase [Lachnospiraceae bacterium]|nr:M56 family metallopeptidase [Lachnospiraceae bacterium]MBD5511308.1 M56 family metallopeptidase [Lachnospiraceae bacterium]